MKIDKAHLITFAAVTLLIYTFFYQLITATVGDSFAYYLFILGYCALLFSGLIGSFSKRALFLNIGWLILLLFSLISNRRIEHGSIIQTIYSAEVVLLAVQATLTEDWIKPISKWVICIGMIHVLATLFFFVFRSFYFQIMLPIYGVAPIGTENGALGYRAGLTSHNSTNGIYCSMVLIMLWQAFTTVQGKRRKRILLIATTLTLIALILTIKREHLLFSLVAIALQYAILSQKRDRYIRIIFFASAFCIVFYVASMMIPELYDVVGRFTNDTDGDISSGRFRMWQLAIVLFLQNPILGIGWFGYRYEYYKYLAQFGSSRYVYNDTHNIYLQLLCETGIIGAVLIIGFMFLTLYRSIKFYRTHYCSQTKNTIEMGYMRFSIAYQIFSLLLGLTGNTLYDITFVFYIISCAIGNAIIFHQGSNYHRRKYLRWQRLQKY